MSDLSDLAEDLTKDLPLAARKVIDAAVENGWELNKPGMTVCLRLNHPTDELAAPVYVTWVVTRTPTGKLGFRFDSCGTAKLDSFRPADVLEYLRDPTVAYMTDEDIEEASRKLASKKVAWDDSEPPETNVARQLGGTVIGIETERNKPRKTAAQIIAESKAKMEAQRSSPTGPQQVSDGQPSRAKAPALRVIMPR